MPPQRKYPGELRERAVRRVFEFLNQMRRFASTLPVILLLTLALPVESPAGAAVHQFGVSSSALITDGVRYAAYNPQPGQLAIRDDQSGRVSLVAGAANCEPLWGAAGTFLVICPDLPPRYFVLNAVSQSLSPIHGHGTTWDDFTGFTRIGADWVEAVTSSAGRQSGYYVNWHNGTRKYAPIPNEDADLPGAPPDLDSPGLRQLGPKERTVGIAFAEGKFLLRQVGTEHVPRDYQDLVLFRKGRRFALLDRCHEWCGSIRLGAKLVTWARGRMGFGYDIAHRRVIRWRLTQQISFPGNFESSEVQHTAQHVFFSLKNTAGGSLRYDVRWTRWPH
jgi:hypothetical protein